MADRTGTDWTGDGYSTAQLYRHMAERELAGISASYEAICRGISDDTEVIALIDRVPGPKRQPNLLLGAVRYLGGPVDTYTAFRDWTVQHWADVEQVILERRTQTNEPGRCAALLPVLAQLDGPIALIEVGASAGLCLYPDRLGYRYRDADGSVHELGGSDVVLECATDGPVPWPSRLPEVTWRAGLDLNPLDVTNDDDVRWLQALIWPEMTDRAERLGRVAALARQDPPHLVAGDLLTDLEPLLQQAPPDATPVVFHTAVLAYLGPQDRQTFCDSVEGLLAPRHGVWISNEAPGVIPGTEAVMRPGPSRFVVARDGQPLALAAPHGSSLSWLDG